MPTRRFIEIENGLVTEREVSVIRTSTLEAFLPLLEHRPVIYSPVLPTNTRAEYWDSQNSSEQKFIFLIEREPQIITMSFAAGGRGPIRKRLSIPWSRFVFTAVTTDPSQQALWQITDYKVFWAKNRYVNPATADMTPVLLPNIYDDGRICFGSTAAEVNQPFSDRMDETVNNFYLSTFNRDLTIKYPNSWSNWDEWERLSVDQPTLWMNWPDWGTRNMYSFETAVRTAISNRNERLVGADGIAPLNLGASWGQAEEWWNNLNNNQRARLLDIATAAQANNPDTVTPVAEPDLTERD